MHGAKVRNIDIKAELRRIATRELELLRLLAIEYSKLQQLKRQTKFAKQDLKERRREIKHIRQERRDLLKSSKR